MSLYYSGTVRRAGVDGQDRGSSWRDSRARVLVAPVGEQRRKGQ
jgi:hypothetical protein